MMIKSSSIENGSSVLRFLRADLLICMPMVLGLLCSVQSSPVVTLASTDEWCAGEWVIFTCHAQGIDDVTQMEWTATSYIDDVLALSTGHDVETKRFDSVKPTFAILTHNDGMVMETKLHILVEDNICTTVNCTVDPPIDTRSISRSEGDANCSSADGTTEFDWKNETTTQGNVATSGASSATARALTGIGILVITSLFEGT